MSVLDGLVMMFSGEELIENKIIDYHMIGAVMENIEIDEINKIKEAPTYFKTSCSNPGRMKIIVSSNFLKLDKFISSSALLIQLCLSLE